MNIPPNKSMGIVVYSPDFAAQINYLDGFSAGYQAIKASVQRAALKAQLARPVEPIPIEKKKLYQLTSEELRVRRQIERMAEKGTPPSVPPSMGGGYVSRDSGTPIIGAGRVRGEENAHYQKRAISFSGMPKGQALVFAGDDCGQGAGEKSSDRIDRMNEKVLEKMREAREKAEAYRRPAKERVH